MRRIHGAFPTSRRSVVKDKNGLDDRGDAGDAAAESSQKAPALQSCHGLLAEAADLGVCAVVPTLPSLEATTSERDADGVVGSLVRLVRPALQLARGERVDDPMGPCGDQVVDGPGTAPQVSQSEQGLSSCGQTSPARLDLPAPGMQPSTQVPRGASGQIHRRRVDKHAKLLVGQWILAVTPPTRSFIGLQSRPTGLHRRQVGISSWIHAASVPEPAEPHRPGHPRSTARILGLGTPSDRRPEPDPALAPGHRRSAQRRHRPPDTHVPACAAPQHPSFHLPIKVLRRLVASVFGIRGPSGRSPDRWGDVVGGRP
ncbi:hypothetical protein GA0115242_146524 [Streptomyces sp. SolWspMP-5a-2]|nr:hypothetical protein GA0115242_146524 [Streptomyces sp. SolWspMP-5a-2]